MKKIITLVLIVAVFVSCFAVPVNAYGTEWIDVLDFYTPNNSGSNFVRITAGEKINFTMPRMRIGYVEFVVQIEGQLPTSCNIFIDTVVKPLSYVKLNNNVYRFYASLGYDGPSGFDLQFNNSGTSWVEFLSFKVSTTKYMNFNLPVSGTLSYQNEGYYFYFNSDVDYEGVTVGGSSGLDDQRYYSILSFADWKKYDYITLQFVATCMDISSITCNLGNQAIECDVSYLSSDSSFHQYMVNVFIDVSNVNRNVSDTLELVVTGNVISVDSLVGSFTIFYCTGFLEQSGLNELLVFFNRISDFLITQFNKVGNWISNSTSTIVSYLEQLVENLVPDSSAAEDAVDDAKDQAGEMNDLTDQMGAMEKPDLSGSGDISGIVSPDNTVKYTLFLNRVVTAPYIGEVVMLCLILSLAGYVLFGKR